MHIMVTNDDGIHAPGILALAEALRELGEVTVVAPDRERSAAGHSLTLHSPLRIFELRPGFFAVDGTPTDCVNMGIHSMLPFRPDLVVSGINHGANLGDDITYSGTVAAAMEATLMGIPAMAVSLASFEPSENFPAAAQVAMRVARQILDQGLPADTFLNVIHSRLHNRRDESPLGYTSGQALLCRYDHPQDRPPWPKILLDRQ